MSKQDTIMEVDICLSPALYPYYKKENDIVIVVDIFRASTTICAMLSNGASSVIPVASIEEAKQYKSKGYIVGGERNAKKLEFADFGNSPFDYKKDIVNNNDIVFTTTNGTQAINAAAGCKTLFIGAFSNIDILSRECFTLGRSRIVVLCAGWKNKINAEDTLFAGAFTEKLSKLGEITYGSDSVRIAIEMWDKAKNDPIEFLKTSEHYKRLINNGAEGDIAYCFKENSTPIVPYYCATENKLRIE